MVFRKFFFGRFFSIIVLFVGKVFGRRIIWRSIRRVIRRISYIGFGRNLTDKLIYSFSGVVFGDGDGGVFDVRNVGGVFV